MRKYSIGTAMVALIFTACAGCATRQNEPAAWARLHGDEDWYKNNNSPEQLFIGVLHRSNEPAFSTVMRSHHYQLGNRFLYPSEASAALDNLVGQNVEIRGKAYDAALEGQSLSEIWVAAIRPADATVMTATSKPVAFDVYDGYFVSNKFEPDAASSFVVLHDRGAFDNVFGSATVMHDQAHRLGPDVFDGNVVVAAIKRGSGNVEFKVTDVSLTDGVLTLRYSATVTPAGYQSACPLILSVPKGDYTAVEFVDNGTPVKRIDAKPAN